MGGNTFLYSIRLATWRNLAVCYVGISKRPHYRFKQHCRSKTPFGEAIRGADGRVVFEIRAVGARPKIMALEREMINSHDTRNPSRTRRCAAIHPCKTFGRSAWQTEIAGAYCEDGSGNAGDAAFP